MTAGVDVTITQLPDYGEMEPSDRCACEVRGAKRSCSRAGAEGPRALGRDAVPQRGPLPQPTQIAPPVGSGILEADVATEAEQVPGSRPEATGRRFGDRLSVWGIVTQLAPFALAFAVYIGVFLFMRPAATGDEPHYLMTAESIAYDGDVELTNDYASRERTLRVVDQFPLGTTFQAGMLHQLA